MYKTLMSSLKATVDKSNDEDRCMQKAKKDLSTTSETIRLLLLMRITSRAFVLGLN